MPKVNKSYRLDEKVVYCIASISKETGKSATAVIEEAIREYDERKDKTPYKESENSHTENDRLYRLLEEQLAIKDEQIRELNRALINAQEQGKAAQLLQANSEGVVGSLEAPEKKPSWIERLKAWMG